MKDKLLFFILLLAFIGPGPLMASNIHDWAKLGSAQSGANFFIDKNSIKSAGESRFFSWIIDLPKPVDGVLSVKEYREVDCAAEKFKVIRQKAYTDSLGKGSEHVKTTFSTIATMLGFVLHEVDENEWETAEPNSVNFAAVKYVCEGPTMYWMERWGDGLKTIFEDTQDRINERRRD